jgi:hypothetical protein
MICGCAPSSSLQSLDFFGINQHSTVGFRG